MNAIDILIILLFLTGLMRGVEVGLIRQVCTTIGLLIGAAIGVLIEGKLVGVVHTPAMKALLALLIITALVGIFIGIGGTIGDTIRGRIERARRLKILDILDRGLGSIVAGLTVLVVVWLGASLFNNVPLRSLQQQVRSSTIVAALDRTFPPIPGAVTKLGHLINPNTFPNVFTGLEPRINTNAPLPSIGELNPAVSEDRASVVKIEGLGCGGISEGSGFIAGNGLVITNAHVVAGVQHPYIIDGLGQHSTTVVLFDPDLDIAILRTSGLAGQPLSLSDSTAANGTAAAVLGYPGGGGFTAHPASVLQVFKAVGQNIYNQGQTERQVYSIKAIVRPGNSGGPLINKSGQAIGVVFAESTTYNDVGYALAMGPVHTELNQAQGLTGAVGTGRCTE